MGACGWIPGREFGSTRFYSLAIATGHSLEQSAPRADPERGDYFEPDGPRPAAWWARFWNWHNPAPGLDGRLRAVSHADTHPPLYYLSLGVWTELFGTSDAMLRLLSTVFGMACFPILWAVGQTIGGRRMAAISCVLFAFAPLGLYYSAEGRMYSLNWLLDLALAWASIRLRSDGFRWHLGLIWVLSAAAALLTHYFNIFVLAACGTWLLLHPGRLRRPAVIACGVVAGVLVAPWYIHLGEMLSTWRVTGEWLKKPLGGREIVFSIGMLTWGIVTGRGGWESRNSPGTRSEAI